MTEDQSKFRATAVAFEDLAAAAYKEEAPRLHNPEFLAAAIRVHSVEARHAAWIRRLAGALPAADAFDEPKPRKEVKRLVASTKFVVTDPVTDSSGRTELHRLTPGAVGAPTTPLEAGRGRGPHHRRRT